METKQSLAGVLPVLQLPFHADESIDWDTLSREIDWAYANGAHGVVAAMVTEVLRLTDAERDELAQRLVKFNAGRGPVVMSVGDESTVQAVRHVRTATAAGVDALMAIPPAASRALLSEKIRYYEAIIAATHLPVIVQDASGYVGEPLPVEAQAELYQRFGDRVLFKPEAQPLGPNLSRLRDEGGAGLRVFEGSGGIALLDSYRRGIYGTMPGTEIVWAIRAEWDALEAGDFQRATELQGIIAPLIFLQQGLDGFLSVEKALLHRQGVFPNRIVRGPVGFTLDPETEREAFRLFDLLCESCGKELAT
ncbi:MAG: dihydrodipicolinate synthase family protein [Alphaproteobacteria bacterium]|nr:dihydrodipicolinate synthase family protein [Alphaproteobacteria bacterium]